MTFSLGSSGSSKSSRLLIAESGLNQRDAELLLLGLLNKDRAWLYARGDDPLPAALADEFHSYVTRRLEGEPIAYILGRREFWSMPLRVAKGVLIPRPDTELLVEWALELLSYSSDEATNGTLASGEVSGCLDLGTGSGAIALAIKKQCPELRVTAVDASEDALAIARENGQTLGLDVEWVHSNWFARLADRRWPLIVSNPPYIAVGDPHLVQGDLPSEPTCALVSGDDGLDDIRKIIAGAPLYLEPGGWLCFEHGWDQAAAVRALLDDAGFEAVESRRDLAGHERVTGGKLYPNGSS